MRSVYKINENFGLKRSLHKFSIGVMHSQRSTTKSDINDYPPLGIPVKKNKSFYLQKN